MVGDMSDQSEFEREILEAMKEVGYSDLESLRDSPGRSDGLKRAAAAELARRAPRIPVGSQLDLETIAGQRMRAGTIEDDLVEAWKELRRLGYGRTSARCNHVDGGPMGSDLQCVLMAGHVGGCRYL
jgi:hypothetical protein